MRAYQRPMEGVSIPARPPARTPAQVARKKNDAQVARKKKNNAVYCCFQTSFFLNSLVRTAFNRFTKWEMRAIRKCKKSKKKRMLKKVLSGSDAYLKTPIKKIVGWIKFQKK